jgi:hypothetical protein
MATLLAMPIFARAAADGPPDSPAAADEPAPAPAEVAVGGAGGEAGDAEVTGAGAEGLPEATLRPTAVSAPATTGADAGGAVMLRCAGADGVFSFDPESDDFVAWAFSPGPIDLTQVAGLHYRFGVVPPAGSQCRIFREPFPPGVVVPLPPAPSSAPGGGSGG